MNLDFSKIGKAIGSAVESIGTYSAKAAAQANAISRSAQSAQGAFNQQSADTANALNQNAMASQWAFNSGQATAANLNQIGMWQTAADWNEEMWERQAAFNREEAEKQRAWQEQMANTQYQRAVNDMSKAGLNPILAVTGGGVGTGVPGGATASVGGAQMSSAQANMASGGLLGANSASESNFMGQMEQMSSTLALIGAIFSGLSSASDAAGGLGTVGEEILNGASDMFKWENNTTKKAADQFIDWFDEKTDQAADWIHEKTGWGTGTKKKGQITNRQDESQYLRYNAWNKSTYKYTKPKG